MCSLSIYWLTFPNYLSLLALWDVYEAFKIFPSPAGRMLSFVSGKTMHHKAFFLPGSKVHSQQPPAMCTASLELGFFSTSTFLRLVKSCPYSNPRRICVCCIRWYFCCLGSQKFKASKWKVCVQSKKSLN